MNSPEKLNEYIRVTNPGTWMLLAGMIEDTESRYGISALSDENLYMVAAAGEPKNYVPGLDGEKKRELM